jgi:hypothetical protein
MLILAGAAVAQVPRPQVVSAGRGWYQGRTLLLRRTPVDATTPLTSANGGGDLILDCGNRGWIVYHCHKDSCSVMPCAEAKTESVDVSRAYWAHITEMLNPLVQREQAEPAVSGVRGSGGPSDAVVLQTPQGIHWGPALTRVLEGSYCLRLNRLPTGPARDFMLNWDRAVEKEGIAQVPNLRPGLYSLAQGKAAGNAACSPDPNLTPAWVLVTPQSAFGQVNKQWEDNSSQVDDIEQTGASTSAVSTLRHAILAWLAQSVESK